MPCSSSSLEELAPKPLPQDSYLVLRVGEDDVPMGHNFHGTEQVLVYGRLSTVCLLHGNSLRWWLPKLDVLAQLSLGKHRRDSEAGKQFLVLGSPVNWGGPGGTLETQVLFKLIAMPFHPDGVLQDSREWFSASLLSLSYQKPVSFPIEQPLSLDKPTDARRYRDHLSLINQLLG